MSDNNILPVKKVNYLNNKDMLKEIHRSKNSYSEYTDVKYQDYDIIVSNKTDIVDNGILVSSLIDEARANRASRLATAARDAAMAQTNEKVKMSTFKIDPSTIPLTDLVFRVYTFEHIPEAPGRKKNPKSVADSHSKLPFLPFKHFILNSENDLIEVGRSHSKNGEYCITQGSITNKLAKMFILMVNKYGQRSNWRGYTYLDEMKGQALLQLAQMGLRFDESKSDNPFSYFTASISNSFTRILNIEKRNQGLRDDLLVAAGANPSFSRQLAIEDEIRRLREDAQSISDIE
jgi:hypothetical protein